MRVRFPYTTPYGGIGEMANTLVCGTSICGFDSRIPSHYFVRYSMNRFVLAQIFGIFGALAMILSSWQKSRKKILFFLLFDNIFYFIQYLLLNAYTGAYTNIIGLIRLGLFSYKGKNDFFKKKYVLYIVCLLYIFIGTLTYDGIGSIFPVISSVIYAGVLWQDNPKYIRIGTTFMLFMWCVYNLLVHAYVGALSEGIMCMSSLLAVIKIDILKNKNPFTKLKLRRYRKEITKLLQVNFVDDYDILLEIFESEDKVVSVLSRFDEYDKDKQILIKILLNISKSLKIKDLKN